MTDDHGQARWSDPQTSKDAASLVRRRARAALLEAHSRFPRGMTDEEAAVEAGLSLASEYATRCSELVRADLLRDTGFTRTGKSGMARMVRAITPHGRMLMGQSAYPEPPPPPKVYRCPLCGKEAPKEGDGLGGYVIVRCSQHKRQVARA